MNWPLIYFPEKIKAKKYQSYNIDKMPFFLFLGDKALRQIIEDSRKIAERCTNPADRDQILRSASDVESMANALSELRQQGKVRYLRYPKYCILYHISCDI